MAGKKRNRGTPQKHPDPTPKRRRRGDDDDSDKPNSINRLMGVLDPKLPHPRDLDQPTDHNFSLQDLGEDAEGEIFDSYEIEDAIKKGRGGANCNSVLVMKYKKPLPMWFDEYLCPRVMPGKWSGYVGYAFRRRIRIGSWPRWTSVPKHVKDDAWNDVLASWDFRTALNKEEHEKLKKQWTTYASTKMRCWRTTVWNRYVNKPKEGVELGHPCLKYRWLDRKEWDLFVKFRSTPEFKALSVKNSERALQKKYHHRTGSGGYRKIYIRKAQEMREKEIEKQMGTGLTREQAEDAVRNIVFKVDRSIVFLEGNKDKKTNDYSDDFVRAVADKILDMNKQKEEGTLIIEGRKDILALVLEPVEDHPGRWRGCPGTAKIDFALPDFTLATQKKRRVSRKKKKNSDTSEDEKELDIATLETFSQWIAEKLGVQIPDGISPKQFLEDQKLKKNHQGTNNPASEPEESIEKGSKPCYLGITTATGSIVVAAAGVVDLTPSPEPGFKKVQIQPPVFVPEAELHGEKGCTGLVSSRVGETVFWPENLISFQLDQQEEEKESVDSPERTQSDSSFETTSPTSQTEDEESDDRVDVKHVGVDPTTLTAAAADCMDQAEEPDCLVKDPAADCMDQAEEPDCLVKDSAADCMDQGEEPDSLVKDSPVEPEPVLLPVCNKTWDFAHHTREPSIRRELSTWLEHVRTHPKTRLMFEIPLQGRQFGEDVKNLTLMLDEALTWMKVVDKRRKGWINGWQMDMWSSLLHSKLRNRNQSRVTILSVNTTFNNSKTQDIAFKDYPVKVVKVMADKPATIYAMPLCTGVHWYFIIVDPRMSVFYCIDSQGNGITKTNKPLLHTLLIRCGLEYDAVVRSKLRSATTLKQWSVVNLTHKIQPGLWECGYYCMLYLEKLVLLYNGTNVWEVFPHDSTPYPLEVIEGMIDTLCFFKMDAIAPVCNARLAEVVKRRPILQDTMDPNTVVDV